MEIRTLSLPDVKLLVPKFLYDERGYFVETWSRTALSDAGIAIEFERDNASLSFRRGTVRGLHFQVPPAAQEKLIRVVHGRVLDIAVDIRHGSPHFGHHVAVELDAESGCQVLIPKGFAHGFCTLEDDTIVEYKCGGPYRPELDMGILWCDPDLAIDWPVAPDAAITSERDTRQPRLADTPPWFASAQYPESEFRDP